VKGHVDLAVLRNLLGNRHEARLKQLGADPNLARRYQIVCLPENFWAARKSDELLEASETADIGKLLKEAGLRCAMPHELGFQTPVAVRRSADLWGGLIWILDNLAAPTFVAVLSSWLTARYVAGKEGARSKPPTVHLAIGIRRHDQLSTLQYDGDAHSLVQILKGLSQPEDDGTNPKE